MWVRRPDVIPFLEHMLQRQYEDGYDSACDTLEETIVELERLRATVVSLQDENSHLRGLRRELSIAVSECCNQYWIDGHAERVKRLYGFDAEGR